MSQQYQSEPGRCQRSAAQQMRLRLARTRVAELHATDLAEMDPASLLVIAERLLSTAEDLIALAEDCTGSHDTPPHML